MGRNPCQLRNSRKKRLRHRRRLRKKKKTNNNATRRKIGQDGEVTHPPPGLGVNGDGTSGAYRTSPSCPFICEVLVLFQRLRKQDSLNGRSRTPTAFQLSHSLWYSYRALTRLCSSEKKLRLIAQPFGIRAADKHDMVRVYTPQRNPHTLHPKCANYCSGCIDVNPLSTAAAANTQADLKIR